MFRIISFCLILFLSCSFKIGAQNIKVESFTRLETDITARVNVVRDANDDECALIKVVTTDVEYNMDESLKRDDSRSGEIWFYVPQGTKRIVIRHQKLGKLVYVLPETLKAKTTYQIKLPGNVEIIVHEDVGGQYVVMSVQPSDASVYVDDILEVMNGGNFSKMLKYGDHAYRVEHPLYETKSGAFTVRNKKEQIEIRLVPAYGYLSFTSTPPNAEITVNGKILGRTPFKSEALREGTYRVKTSLSSYSEDEREVTVVRGQTSDISIPLSATFGYMEVNTVPEQGADVYVNGMKVGKTPYRSDKLSEGICRVKVVQSMYSPQEKEVHIVRGQTEKVSFNLTATFGEVVISSEDPQAEIVINGEKKGIGSWKGRLLEGLYQLAAHKESHRDGTKGIEIKSGMNQQITIPAPTAICGTLNVNSEPSGGVIKIDGKEVGRTPDIISKVLIGERKIEILKEGCAVSAQTVMIEEGKVRELNMHLSQGKEVIIKSCAPTDIVIDGVNYGSAPFKGTLSYGMHNLLVKAPSVETEIRNTFMVTESSSEELFVWNGRFKSLPLITRGTLMNKEDAQAILDKMHKDNQIDWKTFPGGNNSNDNKTSYIIDDRAYVVVEKVIREAKAYFPDYYRDKHSVTLYKYDLQEKKWSLCASAVLLYKTSGWKHKDKPNLPLYRIEVNGQKIVFDSKYQYDTHANRWAILKK